MWMWLFGLSKSSKPYIRLFGLNVRMGEGKIKSTVKDFLEVVNERN